MLLPINTALSLSVATRAWPITTLFVLSAEATSQPDPIIVFSDPEPILSPA